VIYYNIEKDLYIKDMEDIDPVEAKNLLWILDNKIDNLGMNFSVDEDIFGELNTIELIPNGKNI